MSRYAIEGATMTGIADAVRGLRHEKQAMTPAQIEAKIRASRLGIPIVVSNHINPETGEWERPEDWPDLDSITITDDFDGVYLTYDLTKTPGYGWIGIKCVLSSGSYFVERGHLSEDSFIVDETHTVSGGSIYRAPLDYENGDIQLWRVRSDGHIRSFGFTPNSTTNSQNHWNLCQPCVERRGRLSHLNNLKIDGGVNEGNRIVSSYGTYGTIWLERDAVSGVGVNGSPKELYGTWYCCYSLQSLDLSGWDTTGWAVTTLAYCWSNCYSLQSLDLSGWDTTGWAVTDTHSIFSNCQSLRALITPASFGTTTAANNSVVPNTPNLETFSGYRVDVNVSFNNALKLTPQSLVNILDRLPTVTAARTITLGQTNKLKLTDAEIAVATQKGWTVA